MASPRGDGLARGTCLAGPPPCRADHSRKNGRSLMKMNHKWTRMNTNRQEDRWTCFNHKRRQDASAILCPCCDDVMVMMTSCPLVISFFPWCLSSWPFTDPLSSLFQPLGVPSRTPFPTFGGTLSSLLQPLSGPSPFFVALRGYLFWSFVVSPSIGFKKASFGTAPPLQNHAKHGLSREASAIMPYGRPNASRTPASLGP